MSIQANTDDPIHYSVDSQSGTSVKLDNPNHNGTPLPKPQKLVACLMCDFAVSD